MKRLTLNKDKFPSPQLTIATANNEQHVTQLRAITTHVSHVAKR